MKKLVSVKKMVALFLVSALLLTTVVGCGGKNEGTPDGQQNDAEKPAEVITLKFADYYPPTHFLNAMVDDFIKQVEENSNGTIKIERYPAEQLAKLAALLDVCSTGTSDISVVPLSNYAGQLSLSSVLQLPYFTKAVDGTKILNQLYENSPEIVDEYKEYNVIPLVGWLTNSYDIGTTKKQVTKPEDLKGLKLSTSGGYFDLMASKYGITPVSVSPTEIYESTQKGILEGNVNQFPSIKGWKLNELEKYHTFGLRLGASPACYVVNLDTWNKLSPEQQKVLKEAGLNAANASSARWDQQVLDLKKQFTEEGMIITEIPESDLEMWMEPLKGIEQIWIKDMENKGKPGQKVFDEFYKISQEVVK